MKETDRKCNRRTIPQQKDLILTKQLAYCASLTDAKRQKTISLLKVDTVPTIYCPNQPNREDTCFGKAMVLYSFLLNKPACQQFHFWLRIRQKRTTLCVFCIGQQKEQNLLWKFHLENGPTVLIVLCTAVAVCIFQHVDPYLKHKLRQIKDMVEN